MNKSDSPSQRELHYLLVTLLSDTFFAFELVAYIGLRKGSKLVKKVVKVELYFDFCSRANLCLMIIKTTTYAFQSPS